MHSRINIVIRLGWLRALLMTVWRPYSVQQSAQRVTAAACAHLWTGWTEKQDELQIDEANKNYLRNTDHFKVIAPNLNLNERVRDSPVPWHCRAQGQLISFKAAMALRPCVQRRHMEDSSAAWRAPAKLPVRPVGPREVSRRKNYRIFLRFNPRKIRYFRRKIRFRYGFVLHLVFVPSVRLVFN
jgi:hypothetical protein